MSVANVNISIDSEIEAQAQEMFKSLGLDMSTAINIFLRQAIRQHGIPFAVTAEPAPSKPIRKAPKLGCMNGKIWMAEDFDAPLHLVEDPLHAKPVKKTPQLGGWEGKIWMADDFDAPLEEFKEYM